MKREKQIEAMLAIVTGLMVVYLLLDLRWLLTAAIVMGLIGLLVPSLTAWIVKGWMKLSEGMGFIVSRVLMSAIFFLFLFPIAVLSRLFKKSDSLRLRRSKGASYYTERNQTYKAENLENPW